MNIQGIACRTIRYAADRQAVIMLDQTLLPFEVNWLAITDLAEMCHAIASMQVRGAPAIGAAAAYGMVLAVNADASWPALQQAAGQLVATRPTAVNLAWAVERMLKVLEPIAQTERYAAACAEAAAICELDVAVNSAIGDAGATLIQALAEKKAGQPVNILTHCNAGWLATVDWGTALAPIYKAQAHGIAVHVWVDETRPRNQGASLTAFELGQQGVPHTLISDNAGGHLMQHGQVDLCIVGTDRTAANGDVCNKIGTYLKALAANDNQIPFYVALPTSTVDWQLNDGFAIPIEERSADEVVFMQGLDAEGAVRSIRIAPAGTPAANPAFDVTPARLVSGLITEKGVFPASSAGMQALKEALADD